MKVSVHLLHDVRLQGPAAIVGGVHARAADPDALIVVRIDAHLAVVAAARIGGGHLRPRLAFVVAAEHAAFGVLDDRVDDIGIAAIKIDADAAALPDSL